MFLSSYKDFEGAGGSGGFPAGERNQALAERAESAPGLSCLS